MPTKIYKLFTNTTGSNNGVASLKVTRDGQITGIAWALGCLGGAGVGRISFELSKQNTASLTTNDTPDVVLDSVCLASPNAVHNADNILTAGLAIPVQIGDSLYINTAFVGAVAPTSVECNVYVYVLTK